MTDCDERNFSNKILPRITNPFYILTNNFMILCTRGDALRNVFCSFYNFYTIKSKHSAGFGNTKLTLEALFSHCLFRLNTCTFEYFPLRNGKVWLIS